MTDKKLLSIVIPSRNRQKYAIHCIKSILTINDDRIEVVVHDNSDTNELEQLVNEQIKDERLIYKYDSTPMSTVHNFNKAMEYVNGEYLCFIGDDDGVNPEIVEAADWAKKNNIDAVTSKNRIGYLWPNEKRKGKQSIHPFYGKIKNVNIEHELKKFLKDGGVYYLKYDLPKVYHGIVKKECFDKVDNTIHTYFGGLSADIFASISLSLVSKNIVSIDYPLTIAGSSAASEQTHRTEEAKHLKLKNAPHFRARGPYKWSDNVPSVYSGASIWAESNINALETFERHDLIKQINKSKLAAHIVLLSPHYKKNIVKYLKNNKISLFKYQINKQIVIFSNFIYRIYNRFKKILFGRQSEYFYDIKTIIDAVNVFEKYRKRKNVNISDYIS